MIYKVSDIKLVGNRAFKNNVFQYTILIKRGSQRLLVTITSEKNIYGYDDKIALIMQNFNNQKFWKRSENIYYTNLPEFNNAVMIVTILET